MTSRTPTCETGRMPRTPSPDGPTPKRNVRITDKIWTPALARAEAETEALPAGAKKITLTNVLQERVEIYGHPLSEGAPQVDPWEVVELLTEQYTGGGFRDNARADLAITAARDLLRVLDIEDTAGARSVRVTIPQQLLHTLIQRIAPDGVVGSILTLDKDLIPFLEGQAAAGVEGAADLIDDLREYGKVDAWVQQ